MTYKWLAARHALIGPQTLQANNNIRNLAAEITDRVMAVNVARFTSYKTVWCVLSLLNPEKDLTENGVCGDTKLHK